MNKNNWENPKLTCANRLSPHANIKRYLNREDAINNVETNQIGYLSLDGDWDFAYFENPFVANQKIADYTTIQVPGPWQLQGYDQMHYTDVLYPFPINPPFVPKENPVGIYRKQFCYSKSDNFDTILKFEGVSSYFEVYLNDNFVGFSKGSRLESEFNISQYLQRENELVVKVVKWSDGTYLEDQDMWWLSGIIRSVIVYQVPCGEWLDIQIQTLPRKRKNEYELNISVENCVGEITGELLDGAKLVGEIQFDAYEADKEGSLIVKSVKEWTAETPNLYTLVLSCSTEDTTCFLSFKIGFRYIEIKDGLILLNGKNIFFNGVNRHDFSPKLGITITKELIYQDLMMIKENNINAIRTAHYPNCSYLYDLCDEIGLYVIDETDLECHGFENTGDYNWISDHSDWQDAYVDRAIRMISRDKNHPAILFWSLGNESGSGQNFQAMYQKVKAMDPTRLIHYEGDKQAAYSDVFSTMYSTPQMLEEFAKDGEGKKPHILCEYGHAMGNGPGGLTDYQKIMRKHLRLHGGFIWEWVDHGILDNSTGNKRYLYGGDYGDTPTNRNFCIDGLVQPDRNPSPALAEVKQVFSPVTIHFERNKIIIQNDYDFKSLAGFEVILECVQDESHQIIKKISLPAVMPGENFSIPFDYESVASQTAYLNVRIMDGERQVRLTQFLLQKEKRKYLIRTTQDLLKMEQTDVELTIVNKKILVKFDLISGLLLSYQKDKHEIIKSGPQMTFWRAPIDNDMYQLSDWKNKFFLDRISEQLQDYQIKHEENTVIVYFDKYVSCLNQGWGFNVKYIYEIYSDGTLKTKITGEPKLRGNQIPAWLPRIGINLVMDESFIQTSYFGLGPEENYDDANNSATMGVYQLPVSDWHFDYVYPQENGSRANVEWLELKGNVQQKIEFPNSARVTVHDYPVEALEKAQHMDELSRNMGCYLTFDYQQSGLGSNSCGPMQKEMYQTKIAPFTLEYIFMGEN